MTEGKMGRIALVHGMRTPFVKAGTAFAHLDQLDLSCHAAKALAESVDLAPDKIDELVWGRVIHDPRISNLAREIVFRLQWPADINAHLVSNNCITSLYSIQAVADSIQAGRACIGIAGGVESMSNPPFLFGRTASRLFVEAGLSRSLKDRLKVMARLRPKHFKPHPLAFAEPSTGLTMGQHAEITAQEWEISRIEQDQIACASHNNAHEAILDGRLLSQIAPLEGVDRDLIVRGDTSLEKLATLRPVFDRSDRGTLSAGNSSPLTDGAAAVLLTSEEQASKEGLEPKAFIRAVEFSAIDPSDGLLMAPAVAVPRILERTGLTLDDMGLVEIHEAFGAQVAFNRKAWREGWKEQAIGDVDDEKLNVLGGSIAIGHPFAATGARIAWNLAQEMERRRLKYGLLSICAAGAMAGAMILER